MNNLKSTAVFLSVMLLLCSLAAAKDVANMAPYDLNKSQLQALEKKGLKGEKNACMRLAGYCTVVKGDIKEAGFWWWQLAQRGDADGMCGYGACLIEQGKLTEAKEWLLKAKSHGSKETGPYFKELEKARRMARK